MRFFPSRNNNIWVFSFEGNEINFYKKILRECPYLRGKQCVYVYMLVYLELVTVQKCSQKIMISQKYRNLFLDLNQKHRWQHYKIENIF